jgi:hypothetical protein
MIHPIEQVTTMTPHCETFPLSSFVFNLLKRKRLNGHICKQQQTKIDVSDDNLKTEICGNYEKSVFFFFFYLNYMTVIL